MFLHYHLTIYTSIYLCIITGYTGDVCQREIDECVPNPCHTGVCQDEINGYECFCPNGKNQQFYI